MAVLESIRLLGFGKMRAEELGVFVHEQGAVRFGDFGCGKAVEQIHGILAAHHRSHAQAEFRQHLPTETSRDVRQSICPGNDMNAKLLANLENWLFEQFEKQLTP